MNQAHFLDLVHSVTHKYWPCYLLLLYVWLGYSYRLASICRGYELRSFPSPYSVSQLNTLHFCAFYIFLVNPWRVHEVDCYILSIYTYRLKWWLINGDPTYSLVIISTNFVTIVPLIMKLSFGWERETITWSLVVEMILISNLHY